ncbi:hypothetical protein DFH11DRAFT_1717691 [Phellopilus nigrolimitatus]|nr:hypothetical protein DFH11DRAFT_1717691 [Phellopilus nigrolimitatus]
MMKLMLALCLKMRLLENAAETFDPDKAHALWERCACYEYQYGNLEAVIKLQKRMAEAFPKASGSLKSICMQRLTASRTVIAASHSFAKKRPALGSSTRTRSPRSMEGYRRLPRVSRRSTGLAPLTSVVRGVGALGAPSPSRASRASESGGAMKRRLGCHLKRSRVFSPPLRDRDWEQECCLKTWIEVSSSGLCDIAK